MLLRLFPVIRRLPVGLFICGLIIPLIPAAAIRSLIIPCSPPLIRTSVLVLVAAVPFRMVRLLRDKVLWFMLQTMRVLILLTRCEFQEIIQNFLNRLPALPDQKSA